MATHPTPTSTVLTMMIGGFLSRRVVVCSGGAAERERERASASERAPSGTWRVPRRAHNHHDEA
eukprot:73817-Rhodomonas_salina.1